MHGTLVGLGADKSAIAVELPSGNGDGTYSAVLRATQEPPAIFKYVVTHHGNLTAAMTKIEVEEDDTPVATVARYTYEVPQDQEPEAMHALFMGDIALGVLKASALRGDGAAYMFDGLYEDINSLTA